MGYAALIWEIRTAPVRKTIPLLAWSFLIPKQISPMRMGERMDGASRISIASRVIANDYKSYFFSPALTIFIY